MQLTLPSDPRVWMGGGIPTRWRWYDREDRDRRLTFQIDTIASVTLSQKCDIFHTFYTLITVGKVLRQFLRPPFYTLITVGEGLLRSEPLEVFTGRSEAFKGRPEALRGRLEDVQATLRGRSEDVQRRSGAFRGF